MKGGSAIPLGNKLREKGKLKDSSKVTPKGNN